MKSFLFAIMLLPLSPWGVLTPLSRIFACNGRASQAQPAPLLPRKRRCCKAPETTVKSPEAPASPEKEYQ